MKLLTSKSYVYGGIASNDEAVDELYVLTLPSFQWTLVSLSADTLLIYFCVDPSRCTQISFPITLGAKLGCLATLSAIRR